MPIDFPPYDLDEDLIAATAADGRPRVRVLCAGARAVVLGRGSKADVEVDLAACAAEDVPVLRRRGGGCAVLLDPGNLVLSLTLAVAGYGDHLAHFRRISAWIGALLEALGHPGVHQEGISDLAIGDRKVGGACVYRRKDLLYYSTTLLCAVDLDAMERLIRHPPREPDYRQGRRHRDFVTALGVDPAALAARLRERAETTLDALARS